MLRIVCLISFLILVLAGPIYAQSPDTLTTIELAHVTEIRHVLATYGNDVWPGWGETIPPLLLRKGDSDYLIGHPEPPDDFEIVTGLSVDDEIVYRLNGHLTPQPIASVWLVGDRWSVAIPVRDEFQGIIDQALGPGVVVLDDATYIQTIIHEMFHTYQFSVGNPDLFTGDDGVADGEAWIVQHGSDLDTSHAREGEALRAALEADTIDDVRQFVAEFLRLRSARQGGHPPEVAEFEQVTEFTEGLARYAEISTILFAGASGDDAGLAFQYPLTDEVWSALLNQLSDPASVPGSHRDRYYVLGAGQAFVLDRLMPNWHERALVDGVPLITLLAEALTSAE